MRAPLSCVGIEVTVDINSRIFGSEFTINRNNYKFCYWYLKKSRFSLGKGFYGAADVTWPTAFTHLCPNSSPKVI